MRNAAIRSGEAQAGLAYIALLILLTLLFTLGMVFLMQAANDSAAIVARGKSLQAHYLAESAVNHALWRILNENVNTLDDSKYYMHSFAGGRYGYKIRPHTDTTFATVATVGVIGETVVKQSYVLYVKAEQRPLKILFIKDGNGETLQEQKRITLFESWGHEVTTLKDTETQAKYNDELEEVDVVYVSEEANAADIGLKLSATPVGVVSEEVQLADELGFSSGSFILKSRTAITIEDNTHPITEDFDLALTTIWSSSQPVHMLNVQYAPGMQILARTWNVGSSSNDKPSLAVLDVGAQMENASFAPGRRVELPWGGDSFNFDSLNQDGKTILQRSLQWAGELDAGLMAYYPMEEQPGSTVAEDVTGNGYDLTLTNMDPATDWVAGAITTGLDFDGVDDSAVSNVKMKAPTTGTVAFWMKVPGYPTSEGKILGTIDDWEVRHVQPGNPDGIANGLVFDLGVSGVNTQFATTSDFGVAGTWYHIAAVFNAANDTFRVYVDGSLEKSGTVAIAANSSSSELSLGTTTGSTLFFVGTLDDVRIYNRELRDLDIERLYEMR